MNRFWFFGKSKKETNSNLKENASPKNVKFLQSHQSLYQSASTMVLFAWLSEYKQCSSWTGCKAHLQDDLYAFLQNNKASGPTHVLNEPLDLDNVRMLVTFGGKEFLKVIENVLDFIHQYEEEVGFEKTKIEIVPNRKNTVIFIGDKKWLTSLPMLSLYTLLIRGTTNHHVGTPWRISLRLIVSEEIKSHDLHYFRNSHLKIEELAHKGITTFWNNEDIKKNWLKVNQNYMQAGTHADGISYFATKKE